MRANLPKLSVVGLVLVLLTMGRLGAGSSLLAAQATMSATLAAPVTVFATGLRNPRGLTFGPDGFLYVAEGGEGGTTQTTSKDCDQPTSGFAPYSGGMTARISKIAPDGTRTTVVDGLPSSQTSAGTGSRTSGVASVAFIDKTLYALIGGAGCSHGLKDTNNGVVRVNDDGSTTQIANLSAFFKANPTKSFAGEWDGNPFSMVEASGKLYVVNPNHGGVEEVTTDGKITRLIDLSATQGHAVPTTIVFHDGNFYVSNLVGGGKVFKITPKGELTVLPQNLRRCWHWPSISKDKCTR